MSTISMPLQNNISVHLGTALRMNILNDLKMDPGNVNAEKCTL